MSFETKLHEQVQEIEQAMLDLFNYVHAKGSDNPTGLAGQMNPLFHIVDGEWNSHVVGVSWEDIPTKDKVAEFIRQYCAKTGAVLTVFATEAWFRYVKPEEKDPLATGAADHPDRLEALLLTIDSALGQRIVFYPIIRESDAVRLGERQEWPGSLVEGRFTDFVRKVDA